MPPSSECSSDRRSVNFFTVFRIELNRPGAFFIDDALPALKLLSTVQILASRSLRVNRSSIHFRRWPLLKCSQKLSAGALHVIRGHHASDNGNAVCTGTSHIVDAIDGDPSDADQRKPAASSPTLE